MGASQYLRGAGVSEKKFESLARSRNEISGLLTHTVCLNPSSSACVACDPSCLDGTCFSSGKSGCCNYMQDGQCIAECSGNRVGDNSTKLCSCAPNWSGLNCDECTLRCENNGVRNASCSACSCPENYGGVQCEIALPCATQPCQNSAACVNNNDSTTTATAAAAGPALETGGGLPDFALSAPYTCICQEGYTGEQCQTEMDVCDSSPCGNSGACRSQRGDTAGLHSFVCECTEGFVGPLCDVELPHPCEDPAVKVCANSAGCIATTGRAYVCNCTEGFHGQQCEQGPCEDSPQACKNGGACHNLPFGELTCDCLESFTGPGCEFDMADPCFTAPCLYDGTCTSTGQNYSCGCPPNFSGKNCEVGPCEVNNSPCFNGGQCQNNGTTTSGMDCECVEGFSGPLCGFDLADPCSSSPPVCEPHATCRVQADTGTPVCDCPEGFSGTRCENGPCQSQAVPCEHGGTCVNNANSTLFCECLEGYGGEKCEFVPGHPCLTFPCVNSSCQAGTAMEYSCECPPGFEGKHCDVGPCQKLPAPCQHNATCVNQPAGEIECVCLEGFAGQTCQFDLSDPCHSSPCPGNDSTCEMLSGEQYRCLCPADVQHPECYVAPCEANPDACLNGASCVDGPMDEVECVCLDGYVGHDCGMHMDDPCSSSPCPQNASCVWDTGVDFRCHCPENDTSSELCYQEPCEKYPQACQNGASCVNGPAEEVICICLEGYSGADCSFDIADPCLNSTCPDNSTCEWIQGEQHRCHCPPGDVDPLCYTRPCVKFPDACRNGAECVDGPQDEVVCLCLDGFSGADCSFDVNDPCLSAPCPTNSTCAWQKADLYQCMCPPNSTDPACYKPPCVRYPDACRNGAECVNTPDEGIACVCLDGFSGVDCSWDLNDACTLAPCPTNATCVAIGHNETECHCPPEVRDPLCYVPPCVSNPPPCQNGGECVTVDNMAFCGCLDGYHGDLCQHAVGDPCYSSPCPLDATCIQDIAMPDQYRCICPEGSKDPDCYKPPCEANPGICQNGARCENGANATDFTCVCLDGYQGDLCDMYVRNPCQSGPCPPHASCVGNMTSYLCLCPPDLVDPTCYNVPCVENPAVCRHGGKCGEVPSGRTACICLDGWTGLHCQHNVVSPPILSPCIDSDPCQNGGICRPGTNATLGMVCECPPEFSGVTCELIAPPQHQDLCLTDPQTCHPTGDCRNILANNSHACDCLEGFYGSSCEVITLATGGTGTQDACLPNPCWGDGQCIPQANGGYRCECPPGWSGPHCENGGSCADPNACRNGGECISDGVNYICDCVPGYSGDRCEVVVLGDGAVRAGFNPCAQNPCHGNATCRSHGYGFECECPTGMSGGLCSAKGDAPCRVNPCYNDGRCIPDLANRYVCECVPGYTGETCDVILPGHYPHNWPTLLSAGGGANPELPQPSPGPGIDAGLNPPVQYGPGPHLPQGPGVQIPYDMPGPRNGARPPSDPLSPALPDTGRGGRLTVQSPCTPTNRPCGNSGKCVDQGIGYTCDCPITFSGSQCLGGTGGQCGGRACLNGGKCIYSHLNGGHQCSCPRGLGGAGCEINIVMNGHAVTSANPCDRSPCNGGVCSPVVGGYICQCVAPFSGSRCENHQPPHGPTNNAQFGVPPAATNPDLPPNSPAVPGDPNPAVPAPSNPNSINNMPHNGEPLTGKPTGGGLNPSPIFKPPFGPEDKIRPPVQLRPDPLGNPAPLYTPDYPRMGIYAGSAPGGAGAGLDGSRTGNIPGFGQQGPGAVAGGGGAGVPLQGGGMPGFAGGDAAQNNPGRSGANGPNNPPPGTPQTGQNVGGRGSQVPVAGGVSGGPGGGIPGQTGGRDGAGTQQVYPDNVPGGRVRPGIGGGVPTNIGVVNPPAGGGPAANQQPAQGGGPGDVMNTPPNAQPAAGQGNAGTPPNGIAAAPVPNGQGNPGQVAPGNTPGGPGNLPPPGTGVPDPVQYPPGPGTIGQGNPGQGAPGNTPGGPGSLPPPGTGVPDPVQYHPGTGMVGGKNGVVGQPNHRAGNKDGFTSPGSPIPPAVGGGLANGNPAAGGVSPNPGALPPPPPQQGTGQGAGGVDGSVGGGGAPPGGGGGQPGGFADGGGGPGVPNNQIAGTPGVGGGHPQQDGSRGTVGQQPPMDMLPPLIHMPSGGSSKPVGLDSGGLLSAGHPGGQTAAGGEGRAVDILAGGGQPVAGAPSHGGVGDGVPAAAAAAAA
eukprot:scpid7365/ scgid2846/ Neurogenic locus notch homolog protein 1; Translocation-associated notch protein TAN-1; Notch 1 extracellular truncation; Notch 1 intracellular domain